MMQMRAKVVSVAFDPTAPQHGTLTGTGQWQLSITAGNTHTYAVTFTCTHASILTHTHTVGKINSYIKIMAMLSDN